MTNKMQIRLLMLKADWIIFKVKLSKRVRQIYSKVIWFLNRMVK